MARQIGTRSMALKWYGDDIARLVKGASEPGLWAMGQTLLEEAKRRAPRASGRLAESGFIATTKRTTYRGKRSDRPRKQMRKLLSSVAEGKALIGFSAWHSNLIEDSGAGPHAIPRTTTKEGRRRKMLLIPGVGYRRKVSHPGFKRKPFLGPAIDAAKDDGARAFAKEVERRLEAELGT